MFMPHNITPVNHHRKEKGSRKPKYSPAYMELLEKFPVGRFVDVRGRKGTVVGIDRHLDWIYIELAKKRSGVVKGPLIISSLPFYRSHDPASIKNVEKNFKKYGVNEEYQCAAEPRSVHPDSDRFAVELGHAI